MPLSSAIFAFALCTTLVHAHHVHQAGMRARAGVVSARYSYMVGQ